MCAEKKKVEVIAIDGPSGAGKSTMGKILAQELGFKYIDTGAMYRCAALKAIRRGVKYEDEEKISSLLEDTQIEFVVGEDGVRVFLDGEDVTEEIKTEKMGMEASRISRFPYVRAWMKHQQRKMGERERAVLDGRDIGTVVFPDARYKFFLTATLEERAKRRYLELKQKGLKVNYEDVLEEIKKRDEQDATRKHAPLRKAEDAILIDTTGKSIEEVKGEMLGWIEAKYREPL